MKKIILGITIVVVVLLLLAFAGVAFFLDGAVKRGVETVGPRMTKTDVKLQGVSLSLMSGSGSLKGLLVGNPSGYQSPSAINVGKASLSLKPASVFSNKLVIHSVNVDSPEITFETDLKGNNLSKILANVQEGSGPKQASPSESKSSKKFQVDDFHIVGGKIHVTLNALGNQRSATVALPEIQLQNLGEGPDGITAEELTKQVLQTILEKSIQAAASAVTDLSKGALDMTKNLEKTGAGDADKITKSLGGLLKGKK